MGRSIERYPRSALASTKGKTVWLRGKVEQTPDHLQDETIMPIALANLRMTTATED